MPVTVTRANTTISEVAPGWLRVAHTTIQTDADGKPVTIECTLTRPSIEREAGVLLPAPRIKAILEAALSQRQREAPLEIAVL